MTDTADNSVYVDRGKLVDALGRPHAAARIQHLHRNGYIHFWPAVRSWPETGATP